MQHAWCKLPPEIVRKVFTYLPAYPTALAVAPLDPYAYVTKERFLVGRWVQRVRTVRERITRVAFSRDRTRKTALRWNAMDIAEDMKKEYSLASPSEKDAAEFAASWKRMVFLDNYWRVPWEAILRRLASILSDACMRWCTNIIEETCFGAHCLRVMRADYTLPDQPMDVVESTIALTCICKAPVIEHATRTCMCDMYQCWRHVVSPQEKARLVQQLRVKIDKLRKGFYRDAESAELVQLLQAKTS